MMLDNLPVHKTHLVRDHAENFNIELVFNATYSSTYNPIERLWSYSKQRFTRACLTGAPYHL